MSGQVVVYGDLGSQPTRAVISFCKMAKIPHKVKLVLVFKGQNKSKEYMKLNPYGTIPSIQHIRPGKEPFTLYESHAIMRYLTTAFNLPSHWYGDTPLKRSLVDQYLDGHHHNLRRLTSVIFPNMFLPMLIGFAKAKARTDPRTLAIHEKAADKALEVMELNLSKNKEIAQGKGYWLASVGEKPSIADLSAFCELWQMNYMPEKLKKILSKYSLVAEWFARLQAIPEIADAHAFIGKAIPKFLKQHKAKQEKEAARAKL